MPDLSQAPEPSLPMTEAEVELASRKEPESPYTEAIAKPFRDIIKQNPRSHVGNFYVKEVLQFIDAFRNLECPDSAMIPLSLFHFLLDDFRAKKSGAKPFRRVTLTWILNTLNEGEYGIFRPFRVRRSTRQKFTVLSPFSFRTNVIQFPDGTTWKLPPFEELPVEVKLQIHRMNKRSSDKPIIYPF